MRKQNLGCSTRGLNQDVNNLKERGVTGTMSEQLLCHGADVLKPGLVLQRCVETDGPLCLLC